MKEPSLPLPTCGESMPQKPALKKHNANRPVLTRPILARHFSAMPPLTGPLSAVLNWKKGTLFADAALAYADFSHADLTGADFQKASLNYCRMHRVQARGVNWRNAELSTVIATDQKLASAEQFKP